MSYDYKLFANDGEMTVESVQTIERTDEDYTFLDENGDIVVMLKKDRVEGIIREPVKKKGRETRKPDNWGYQNPLGDPETKQLKKPVNKDIPPGVITPNRDKQARHAYQFKQNQETKGYEIHGVTRSVKNDRLVADTNSGTTEKTTTNDQSEQLVELRYKDIVALGLYNPKTKKVIIEKGSLISKNETHTLRKSKSRQGVRVKRREILRKWTKPYNQDYGRLTQDIEFNSLTQACCSISGTVLNPKQYWKSVG